MTRTRTTKTRVGTVALAALALLAPVAACAKTDEPAQTAPADTGAGSGAGSTPGSTTGTTSGSTTGTDDEERPTPDQDVDADRAIAEAAVLTEADVPGWTADETSADEDQGERTDDTSSDDEDEAIEGEDDDESFADGLQECGETAADLEADYGDAITQLETAPDADAPDFEQTTDTAFRGLFNNVMVLADGNAASQAIDLMADERMIACFEEEIASDPDFGVAAEPRLEVAEVDLGDRGVTWTITMSMDQGSGQSGEISMAMYFVQVDRALAMFMFMGAGFDEATMTMSSMAPDELVGADGEAAIDAVVTRLEEALG